MTRASNRRQFIKTGLSGGLGLLLAGPLFGAVNQRKIYKTDCSLPRRIFQNSSTLQDVRLKEVIDDPAGKKVLFVFADGQIKEYRYADSFRSESRRGKREGMKLKILLSYSLYTLCSNNRKKEKRKTDCRGDELQRQKFLEGLAMDKYAAMLQTF